MKTLSKIIMAVVLMASFMSCSKNGGHEYVDLGLPSGTLWATCNVGANSPEEFGDYFAWGETKTKDVYNWETYKYCNGGYGYDELTKYCNESNYGNNGFTDNLTVLLPEDDAATTNWGSQWKTPTEKQWIELQKYTTRSWTKRNGVSGYQFTASNGNSIFLPAAGYRRDDELHGVGDSSGDIWSSSLSTTPFWAYYFFGDSEGEGGYRCDGLTVRPVFEKSNDESETSSNKKEEVSSKNMYKAFSKAIDKKGYVSFLTQYSGLGDGPYHMVFFPFVFSQDGLEGMMYLVSFNERSLWVAYYADYKVEGDYLRLTNIVQINDNSNARPKIFKMSKQGDKISLEGRFIRQWDRSVSVEETEGLPQVIVNMLENNENNMHSY